MHKNIVLIGMPGCGKSTLGFFLSKKLGLDFIDLDVYIETKENKKIPEIFQKGEDYFRDLEAKSVEEVSEYNSIIISTGGGVIKREENIKNLKHNGKLIFIDRPLEKILEDIDTENRPLLKYKKDNLYNLYKERYDLYKKYADYRILNEGSLEEALNEILNLLEKENII
ncbi:shikimate kinase [Hathewaya massiliensis]|uniref:shikimate kinase n=1 Tax=Hathewaya massiliensis TaxID=1964382 RepID=UPI0011571196|nr:shikimate kinase [Hathewaya massiliensis]